MSNIEFPDDFLNNYDSSRIVAVRNSSSLNVADTKNGGKHHGRKRDKTSHNGSMSGGGVLSNRRNT